MSAKGHVVVCSPVLPEFDREAGSAHLFHHVQMLRESGWHVSYVTENPDREQRYVRALQQAGCPVYLGFGPRVDALFSLGHVDVAIIAFWYLAEQQMDRIRSLSPSTRIVIDSIDLHFLREARRLLGNDGDRVTRSPLNAQYADEFVREITAYSRADAVITVSQKEADAVNDFIGGAPRAEHVAQAEASTPSPVPLRDRRGILFVGNFRHRPNLDAVEYLFGDILPKLDQQTLSRHPLTVVGNGLTERVRALAEGQQHVRMVGWVPSLAPYYRQARVSVVPLLYGAGTKRKVIESLMSGLPTVSTSVGVEGLDLHAGRHVLVADDPTDFAEGIKRLTTDSRLWRRLSTEGAAEMAETHGWERARGQLLSLVERLASEPPPATGWATAARRGTAYEQSVTDLTRWLHDALPGDASVAVATKGDDDLLELGGRRATHLPRDEDGNYAGYHPASSTELLGELDRWVAHGGDHLVIPATSSWWLEHYSQLSAVLAKDWENLCAPTELGHVFRHQYRREDVDFQCNICGAQNQVPRSMIDRETPSCGTCGSTPRSRALVEALAVRLFDAPLVLSDIGARKDLSGLGLSDWEGYAHVLRSRFSYTNTFFRSDPSLDITTRPHGRTGEHDFVIASEVFDHVVGDIEQMFANVRTLLKPDGTLVFTVPYTLEGPTVEHEGASDPSSPTAGFIPARQFSLESLHYVLDRAGFKDVTVHAGVNREFGIWWTPRVSVPLSARADS
jgi:glycosyltransferase involved in cell wall biosynthesis